MQAHGLNCIRLPHLCSSEEIPKFKELHQPSPVCCHVRARTGMCVSQVTDEVLYTGLVEMYELEELEE